ncbi:MAG: NAD(P)H-hydrate dehydratase, partial [Eubacteriales bacterium]|nr:NAD(P)H-hydrate dehydratase [Eubacteriales bacterium]
MHEKNDNGGLSVKRIVTAMQMRALERAYMEKTDLSSDELMLRAARALTDELCVRLGGAQGRICVFACGNGGNGGDGYAAARMFAEGGGRSILLDVAPELPRRPDAARMRRRALEHANVWQGVDFASMPRPHAWVDSVFGIGLSRAPSEEIAALFERMEQDRRQGSLVLSCDIPSGLHADSGAAPGAFVRADCTVTFEYPKPGHYLGRGMDVCGQLVVRSIGIGPSFLPQESIGLCEAADIAPACAPRPHDSHKGTYGHLLVVAGSLGMAGAAALCTGAALRSGAGLVSVACPASIVPVLQTLEPCAMCIPLLEENGALCAGAVPALREALCGKSAVAIGPGLSRRCAPEVVRCALESELPLVLDADALNLLAQERSLLALLSERCLLTPHPGEAARLVGPAAEPLQSLQALRSLGCTALLKGAATLVSGPEGVQMSTSGCPGMARGGSGDLLTGIAGALLARGFAPQQAACIASEAHGLAGERAAARIGETGMTAQDILGALP